MAEKDKIELRILPTGTMHADLTWLFIDPGRMATRAQPEKLKDWVEIPTHVVYIEHLSGKRLLWDAGVPRVWETRWGPTGLDQFFPVDAVTEDMWLDSRLKQLNVEPGDIDYLLLSHLHMDHAANTKLFQDSGTKIIVDAEEKKGALSFDGHNQGAHIKSGYDGLTLDTVDEDTEILPGITLPRTSGHAWGTMSLKVDLADSGTFIFTSDSLYLKESYGPPRSPPASSTTRWPGSARCGATTSRRPPSPAMHGSAKPPTAMSAAPRSWEGVGHGDRELITKWRREMDRRQEFEARHPAHREHRDAIAAHEGVFERKPLTYGNSPTGNWPPGPPSARTPPRPAGSAVAPTPPWVDPAAGRGDASPRIATAPPRGPQMKTTAAVVHEAGKPLEIEDLDLDGPREGEILVRYTHAGLCHSDLHVMNGEISGWLPMVLGHEGAGVVEDVGSGVTRVAPGDHIVCSFIPSCGSCHWCATGQQAICDWGANIMRGFLPGEHWPLSGPSGRYGAMCLLGTFSQYGVIHQYSAVKIDPDLPLDVAALVGCGVPTGWGSAVNAANVRPGQTVVVYGVGGIGINAVQGARFAGAKHVIAVDPVALKRETALRLGATHATDDADEAHRIAAELTRGVGADKAIVTVGTTSSEVIDQAFNVVGKAGTVVLTSMGGGFRDRTIQLPAQVATLWKKTIKGSLFGDCNPTTDIPRLLGLYQTGDLKLDEIITRTYPLEQVNEGYEDLVAGRNVRGIIVHTHD